MPLYEYLCAKGHRYEKQEPFGSPAEQPCERPRCKATARRVLIPPQVHFKGSGWYVTDSRSSRSSSARSSRSSGSNGDAVPASSGEQAEGDLAPRPPEATGKS